MLCALHVAAVQAWQLPPPTPRIPVLSVQHHVTMVAGVTAEAGAAQDGGVQGQHVAAFMAALERAVDDRRRVDELVTLFEYGGRVEAAGEHYAGQGAVKRFFSSMLLSGGVTALDVLDEPSTEADHTKLHIVLTGDAGQHELLLRAEFQDGLVRELQVQEVHAPVGAPLLSPAAPSAHGEGPKWETFDGRVRQKIWQRQDCFEVGRPRGKSRPHTHTPRGAEAPVRRVLSRRVADRRHASRAVRALALCLPVSFTRRPLPCRRATPSSRIRWSCRPVGGRPHLHVHPTSSAPAAFCICTSTSTSTTSCSCSCTTSSTSSTSSATTCCSCPPWH